LKGRQGPGDELGGSPTLIYQDADKAKLFYLIGWIGAVAGGIS
jgi:hypothetical protein